MSSILTNTSALVALQTLKSINTGMGKVQNEISTGLKVATAKDNSSSWSIASTMNSDVKTFGKLAETVVAASATVGTARAAAEQVAEILKQIQTKFVQAEDYAAGSPELTAIQDEVDALTETIVSIATAAQVNGVNLTAAGATDLNVTVSVVRDAAGALTAEAVTVTAQDLEALGAADRGQGGAEPRHRAVDAPVPERGRPRLGRIGGRAGGGEREHDRNKCLFYQGFVRHDSPSH